MLKFGGAFIVFLSYQISECIKIPVFFHSPCTPKYVFGFFLSISINYWDTTGFVCFFFFETTVHIIEVQSVGFLFMYLFHSSLIYFNC